MSKSVDDLIEAIGTSNGNHGCWAQTLEGDASEFVEKVKAKERQLGKPLNRGALIDTLREEFGVAIGQSAMVKHLKDRCRCA